MLALPKTGWVDTVDIEAGQWVELAPEAVDVPACFGLARGVWYAVTQGLRGVLVRDEQGAGRVYLLTKEATHYWRVMTGLDRMPVLIWQEI